MPNHPFLPIVTKDQFAQALAYVAEQSQNLLKELTGQELPMLCVRLFAHDPDEYKHMEVIVRDYGPLSKVQPHSGFMVDCTLTLAGRQISKVGIRPPDPERPEVGHADFITADYPRFVAVHHNTEDSLTRPMPGREDELFELRHPSFDVLVYVVPASH